MINVTINNKKYQSKIGNTILDVCKENNIYIPTLCYFEGLPSSSKCGLCVVKVDGSAYALSCITPIKNSMVIETDSSDVINKSQEALEKFIDMSLPPKTFEIEEVYQYLHPKRTIRLRSAETTNSIKFNPSTCILCDRCVRICSDTLQINALNDPQQKLRNNSCISCGLCTTVCPTDAFIENQSNHQILRALGLGMTLVLLISPSVISSLMEIYGNCKDLIGRVITAAKLMGFSFVYNTSCGIDVTVFEEASEFLERIDSNHKLPMFSSNCPSWVNFIEKHHQELIPNLTTVKSPHIILGRLVRSRLSQQKNIEPNKIHVVSLLSCTAAKDEIKRMQLIGEVNTVITTREFVNLLNQFNLDLICLKVNHFDPPFNNASKMASLDELPGHHISFMLRTIHAEGDPSSLYIENGISSTAFTLNGRAIRVAVCAGIGKARDLIESGHYKDYSYIEVLSCPFGCSGGGGQLKTKSSKIVQNRMNSIIKFADPLPDLGILPISEPMFRTHFEPQESVTLKRNKKPIKLPIVAYGSHYGHSQQYSRVFALTCGSLSLSMNQIPITDLIKSGIAIFFISTGEDGSIPMNSQYFFDQLSISELSLSDVQFAICALGHKKSEYFCKSGKVLFDLLKIKGAKPLIELLEIDEGLFDKGVSILEKWAFKLSKILNLIPPRFGVVLKFSLEESDDKSVLDNPLRPVGFEIAELISSNRLTAENIIPPMHQHIIKLPPGVDYETGDHFTILPENDPEAVQQVIQALNLNENQVFIVKTSADAARTFVPEKISIKQLFTQYLDLNGSIDRFLVQAFFDSADDELQNELKKYIENDNELSRLSNLLNIGEFIIKFSTKCKPDLPRLMSACPHIQPRVFSIASAPSSNRGFLELLVHSVVFGLNNKRKGLATSFLQRKGVKRISVACHKGIFKYPSDKSTPLILCGIGSGLAPILAVLQHRASLLDSGIKLGPAILFFGARYRSSYPLLMKKLAILKEKKSADEVFTAFSRDGPTPVYIQDILKERSNIIWNVWSDQRSILYYCGPRRGIPDDIREILTDISTKEGQLPRDSAETFCQSHQFVMESYG